MIRKALGLVCLVGLAACSTAAIFPCGSRMRESTRDEPAQRTGS